MKGQKLPISLSEKKSNIRNARARVAIYTRYGNTEKATEAKRDLKYYNLEVAILDAVLYAPELTGEQTKKLTGLLNGGAL